MSIDDTCKSMAHDVESGFKGKIPCAHAASGGMCSFCAVTLKAENDRLRALAKYIIELGLEPGALDEYGEVVIKMAEEALQGEGGRK